MVHESVSKLWQRPMLRQPCRHGSHGFTPDTLDTAPTAVLFEDGVVKGQSKAKDGRCAGGRERHRGHVWHAWRREKLQVRRIPVTKAAVAVLAGS
jgi:hypothetical protein